MTISATGAAGPETLDFGGISVRPARLVGADLLRLGSAPASFLEAAGAAGLDPSGPEIAPLDAFLEEVAAVFVGSLARPVGAPAAVRLGNVELALHALTGRDLATLAKAEIALRDQAIEAESVGDGDEGHADADRTAGIASFLELVASRFAASLQADGTPTPSVSEIRAELKVKVGPGGYADITKAAFHELRRPQDIWRFVGSLTEPEKATLWEELTKAADGGTVGLPAGYVDDWFCALTGSPPPGVVSLL